MIFDTFDACYYINLNSRPDRKEIFEVRACIAGIPLDSLIRYPAVQLGEAEAMKLPKLTKYDGDTNWYLKLSSSLSHYNIIKEAKEKGYNSVLIFEDDAVFVDNFEERVKPFLKELREALHWDILYFGGSPDPTFKHNTWPCVNVSERLCTIDTMWCIHAYAIHSDFYDAILATNVADIYPWDLNLIHYPSDKRIYLMTKELLVIQDDESFSDVSGKVVPRNEVFKENYAKVIK